MTTELTTIEPQAVEHALPSIVSNLPAMKEYADIVIKSGLIPRGLDTPEKLIVAMACGRSIGLDESQSVRGIMVVNNRPCVWGDIAMMLVQRSPACLSISERIEKGEDGEPVAYCTGRRKRVGGEIDEQTRTFSLAQAKRAGLLDKTGPWKQYTARMLQMRARGFLLRDLFPDLLNGMSVVDREEYAAETTTQIKVEQVQQPVLALPDPDEEVIEQENK